VKKLPLEVAEVDDVVVDDRQGADAGRGQCHDDGGAEPAGAHDGDMRGRESALTEIAHAVQHEVALRACAFGGAEVGSGVDERRQRHGASVSAVPVRGAVRHKRLPLSKSANASSEAAFCPQMRAIVGGMRSYRVTEAARLLGVSDDTLRRWVDQGILPTTGASPVEAAAAHADVLSSARNRFVGLVTRVQQDGVMAQVDIQSGPHRVVSLMSAEAVRDLGLEPGALAVAVIKATSVIVETPKES